MRKVSDISSLDSIFTRAMVLQQKTQMPVHFEITASTHDSLQAHIANAGLSLSDFLFKSRLTRSEHISTRQYAGILKKWVPKIGLDSAIYAAHSMRGTKSCLIYKCTKNLRAVQLLLGHTKLESTVKHLDIEVEGALEIAEKMEI